MGLVYVVADQQCVLVFASHRHSSYRFGFLRVGPRRPSPVVYNTVRGTVERPRRRAARAGRTRRADRTPCGVEYDDAVSTASLRDRSATPDPGVHTRRAASGCDCEKSGLPRVDSRAGTCAKPKDEKPSRAESPQSSHLRATVARRRPALGPA